MAWYFHTLSVKRWTQEWHGPWMIFARRSINIDGYPAIKRHLLQFRERLEPRPKDWSGGRWPGRKPGSYKWYEIQDAIEYWQLFSQPKSMYQEIQFHPQYSFDTSGVLTNDKGFFLSSADH